MGYELRLVGAETWIVPFQNFRLTEKLNYGVSATVNINFQTLNRYAQQFNKTADDVFSDAYMEWKLYRDEVLQYGGVLQHRKISGSKGQGASFNCNLLGYQGLLKNRFTRNLAADWYSSEDSADIAWGIIDATNTINDTGITRGLHPATVDRDRTFRFDNILDAIIGMSNAKTDRGYDWDISASKVFTIYYPAKGSSKPTIILDDFNIIDWNSDRDLSAGLANNIIAIGSGEGEEIIFSIKEDAGSISTWKNQEATIKAKDIITTTELDDKANKLLEVKYLPQEVISLSVTDKSPDITTYAVGDTVRVKIADLNFNDLLRIDTRTLEIDGSNATVTVGFEYATA